MKNKSAERYELYKSLKKLLLVLLSFFVLFIFFVFLLVNFGKRSGGHKQESIDSSVAYVEYLNPTKEQFSGSILKYTYRFGTLTVDRSFAGTRRLTHDRLFVEIYTDWPEFGDEKQYLKSDPKSILRIMFEIGGEAPFRDVYTSVVDTLDKGGVVDSRFSGFIGYERENGWVYITTKDSLLMPQRTPVAIACTGDNSEGVGVNMRQGRCWYNFIFDKDLRAQVRFNKPLMNNFSQVHKDLLKFMNSIRESK